MKCTKESGIIICACFDCRRVEQIARLKRELSGCQTVIRELVEDAAAVENSLNRPPHSYEYYLVCFGQKLKDILPKLKECLK